MLKEELNINNELIRRSKYYTDRPLSYEVHRVFGSWEHIPYELEIPIEEEYKAPEKGFEKCIDLFNDPTIRLIYRMIGGSKIDLGEYMGNRSYSVMYEFKGYRK